MTREVAALAAKHREIIERTELQDVVSGYRDAVLTREDASLWDLVASHVGPNGRVGPSLFGHYLHWLAVQLVRARGEGEGGTCALHCFL